MPTRRDLLRLTGTAIVGAAMLRTANAQDFPEIIRGTQQEQPRQDVPYKPVITPNGWTLPFRMNGGVKEFHLVAEPVEREFSKGMIVKCWGYNGTTPGPTIECVEGDRVRIFVTNHLTEHTSIHWHGVRLPNGMDGVGGLTQPHIEPGETYVYEFTLNQSGTLMYHPHADEMVQIALGMMGLFIIHPAEAEDPAADRDFAIMLHEWAIHPGTYRPDPAVMLDFNMFTFNSKLFPEIDHLLVRINDRVRIRLANLSMNSHPIHLHGHRFWITGTDAGPIPESARWPENTVSVPVGSTRDIQFIADNPGDWVFHCHKTHHVMNAMGHEIPNTLAVNQRGLAERVHQILPGYMPMGEHGMAEMQQHALHMQGPENTLPMMAGNGPYGNIEMGGMMTVLKVREQLENNGLDPGWYNPPPELRARRVPRP